MNEEHPVRFSVEYPDRPLNRLSTAIVSWFAILVTDRYPPFSLGRSEGGIAT